MRDLLRLCLSSTRPAQVGHKRHRWERRVLPPPVDRGVMSNEHNTRFLEPWPIRVSILPNATDTLAHRGHR
ncbi:hypothetical protein GCM10022222_84320 [Amycolatopsis ultiminotia]|uniref:Uncharacterized protein n=1 Tax=Amycolatopsis ultiminotia TaxID=543629 RepID=A0ABP6YMN1_9PSEU